MKRAAALIALLSGASCAFPLFPGSSGGGTQGCPVPCAGTCDSGTCVASPEGGSCRASASGPACATGTTCANGRCVVRTTTSASYPPVALGQYLETLRASVCAYLVRCDRWPRSLADRCPEAVFPSTPIFDSAAEEVALASRGDVAYDSKAAGDCLGADATLDCQDPPPPACGSVFGGKLEAGASCTASVACQSGSYCELESVTGLACAGTCAARAKAGGDCDQRPCAAGLVCVPQSGSAPVCRSEAPPATDGAACGPGPRPCGYGLYCAASGLCEMVHQQGQPCDEVNGCAPGLICAFVSPTSAVCLPRRHQGQSCQSDQQCSPMTMVLAANACVDGHCEPLPGGGNPCAPDSRLPNTCDPASASCRSGTCAAFSAEGESCGTSAECGGQLASEVCSYGSCGAVMACGP